MIWQHHECIDRECLASASRANGSAQKLDLVNEQGLTPVQQVYCEEPASARNERATIIRHEAQDSTNANMLES
jgi:hypothetical protein